MRNITRSSKEIFSILNNYIYAVISFMIQCQFISQYPNMRSLVRKTTMSKRYNIVYHISFIFQIICCVLAVAYSAKIPKYHEDPILRLENNVDPNGQYKYGFESNRAARDEVRGADGVTKGFYAYIDDEGKQQYVGYRADSTGYHTDDAGVQETPEVAAARASHLEAFRRAQQEAINRPRQYEEEYEDEEDLPVYKIPTRAQPVAVTTSAPVEFFPKQPAVRTPARSSFVDEDVPLYSTSSLNEPCHGPLCNLKYQEVQKSVSTEERQHQQQRPAPVYVPQNNQHFLRSNVENLNTYRSQVPGKDYSKVLIAAAKAYTSIIKNSN